tara:strand:- start:731 stop:1495 length:765 start_codon:yes stop_codon:yes gene_type:complete
MIDSHCHLDQQPLVGDLNNIINRSKEAGIEKLLTISTTLNSFSEISKLVNFDPIIYGTFGIHPHEADKEFVSKSEIIDKIKTNKKIIGVGETGLDFYYNNSDKKNQINSFINHIEAAIDLNIPLIVHSRNAETDTFDIINRYKNQNLKVLMHCFTGSLNLAKKLLDLDAFFSASGIITFKNSNSLQDTFKFLPDNKILIETDSPYLAPEPMRGKKNEPSFIHHTLKKLAQIKKIEINKLDNITTNNFNNLFFSK